MIMADFGSQSVSQSYHRLQVPMRVLADRSSGHRGAVDRCLAVEHRSTIGLAIYTAVCSNTNVCMCLRTRQPTFNHCV